MAGAVIIATLAIITLTRPAPEATGKDMLPVALRLLPIDGGWGYEILVDQKVFIHQDCIPAVDSFRTFSSKADAQRIGEMVMEKIKSGQKPAVTREEIRDSHIAY